MKVYLVMQWDWEDGYADSIWSTKEAAEGIAASLRRRHRDLTYEVIEFSVDERKDD